MAELVGVLAKRGRFLVAESLFERGQKLVVDRDSRARVGDLVVVRTKGQGRGHAKILRKLGRPDNAGDVLEALMLDRGLRRRFDRSVDLEAQRARDDVPRGAESGRSDLRELATFTIDPVTAQDFDDAISAQRRDDGTIRVWVHIADVSAFVRPGGAVDREAARRSTSVYVPGRVEPMLPEALSNDACSLRPYADRLAVTVRMDVADDGTVRRVSFTRSMIRSDERLDYPRVDRIFAGSEGAAEPWAESLQAARDAARSLATRRARGSALEIENPEPEFAFDRKGQVTSMAPSMQTESHRLIEHLMIAANEQVARHLEQASVPALYRVHEPPEPEAARRLVAQLASLDVATPPAPDHLSSAEAAELIAECSRRGGRARAPPRRPGTHGADVPRPARAQAGPLRAAQPRPRRPRPVALLPLHVADPPLPGPRLPPRPAVVGRRRGGAAGPRPRGGARDVDVDPRARRDDDRARRRPGRALLPARARARRRRGSTRGSPARSRA